MTVDQTSSHSSVEAGLCDLRLIGLNRDSTGLIGLTFFCILHGSKSPSKYILYLVLDFLLVLGMDLMTFHDSFHAKTLQINEMQKD